MYQDHVKLRKHFHLIGDLRSKCHPGPCGQKDSVWDSVTRIGKIMIDFNRFPNIPPVCHWLQYRYPCQKPSADDWANAVVSGLDAQMDVVAYI